MGTAQAAITMVWTPQGGTPISLGPSLETAEAWIETKAIDIGDQGLSYFIDRIISNLSDASDQTRMRLEIYGSDSEDGDPELGEENPTESNMPLLDVIDLSRSDPGYTDPPGKRYYRFRFTDDNVQERWRIHGFTVYGEPGGDEF